MISGKPFLYRENFSALQIKITIAIKTDYVEWPVQVN